MVEIAVQGLADLHKALQELPVKIERNVLRGGLRAGAVVIRDEARRRVHDISGELSASIRVTARTRRGLVKVSIKAGNQAAYYAHMVEFGTAKHWIRATKRPIKITRRGARRISIGTLNRMAQHGSLVIGGTFVGEEIVHPGSKRKPFLRPALDARANDAVEAIADYIRQRLPKELGKLIR